MATVDVLLAAYNGEKYIREQLDSILGQSYRDFKIIIRDDGSKDATPQIIREYEGRYPGVVEVVSDNVVCGSAACNFFQLIRHASSDYVMFSDQDDYWLPDKIKISLSELQRIEAQKGRQSPALVFADYDVADASLNRLPFRKKNNQIAELHLEFNRLLVQNYVTGCLIMANRSLYEAMGDYSKKILMHDWWAALYASACGTIHHVPEVVMLYRQHGDNSVGAVDVKSLRYRIKKFMASDTGSAKNFYLEQALLFRERYAGRLSGQVLKQLDDFINLYGLENKFARIKALFRGKYLKSDWARILGQVWYI